MIERRFILLGVGLACGLALSACNGGPEAVLGGEARAQSGEEVPSDGSIRCPPGQICPNDEAGMIIPLSALSGLRQTQIVCVSGDPKRLDPKRLEYKCPRGLNGRLWEPVPTQHTCHPLSTDERCTREGVKGNYAFLCKRNNPSTKNCPGVPGLSSLPGGRR